MGSAATISWSTTEHELSNKDEGRYINLVVTAGGQRVEQRVGWCHDPGEPKRGPLGREVVAAYSCGRLDVEVRVTDFGLIVQADNEPVASVPLPPSWVLELELQHAGMSTDAADETGCAQGRLIWIVDRGGSRHWFIDGRLVLLDREISVTNDSPSGGRFEVVEDRWTEPGFLPVSVVGELTTRGFDGVFAYLEGLQWPLDGDGEVEVVAGRATVVLIEVQRPTSEWPEQGGVAPVNVRSSVLDGELLGGDAYDRRIDVWLTFLEERSWDGTWPEHVEAIPAIDPVVTDPVMFSWRTTRRGVHLMGRGRRLLLVIERGGVWREEPLVWCTQHGEPAPEPLEDDVLAAYTCDRERITVHPAPFGVMVEVDGIPRDAIVLAPALVPHR